MKKLSGIAFVAVFSFVLLLAADRVLGLAGFPVEPPLPIAHAPDHTEVKKYLEFGFTIRTNDRGIRYPTIPLEKPAGETRVVVLGDSFTEGKGVEAEHTWPAVLERRFSQNDRLVRFINCGLIGAGPDGYARMLYHVGLKYRPDRVLLAFYANDIADTPPSVTEEELRTGQGWLVPRTDLKLETPKARTGLKALAQKLFPHIYVMADSAKERIADRLPSDVVRSIEKEARHMGIPQDKIDAWREKLPGELVQAANEDRMDPYMLSHGLLHDDIWLESLDLSTHDAEPKWNVFSAMLSKIAALCREQSIPLQVVYLPSPIQYDPSYASPSEKIGVVIRREWLTEESEFQKRLSRWTAQNDLPFLDLTPGFREAAAQTPGLLNYQMDPHWTPKGNELAARLIGDWLEGEAGLRA